MRTPLRIALAALLLILFVAAPAGGPAAASIDPPPSAIADVFERLTRAQTLRNFPNSHVKSAELRGAEQAGATNEIRELSACLALRLTRDQADALLDAAVRRADPDALERAQVALRVLGARGVPWDRVREELPLTVAYWESVLEGCWREGQDLRDHAR